MTLDPQRLQLELVLPSLQVTITRHDPTRMVISVTAAGAGNAPPVEHLQPAAVGSVLPQDQAGFISAESIPSIWGEVQHDARLYVREIARVVRAEESCSFDHIFASFRTNAAHVKGAMSSLYWAVAKRYPGKKFPLTRDYNRRRYYMPLDVADMIITMTENEQA